MACSTVLTKLDLSQYGLKKTSSGKVREIYEVDTESLLFIATDRISAYDVILENGVPEKGALLTQLSAHWFRLISTSMPNLRTHLISTSVPSRVTSSLPVDLQKTLSHRSMHVRRYQLIPLESIVRGYITGSAWSEYKKSGTVHGMSMPAGLQESQKLDSPIWTPSTKAEQGAHDENISRDQAVALVGEDVAKKVEEASLSIYALARDYAATRGIIIADTKFEFGIDPTTQEIVLVDEVLTPDSSRFWPAQQYTVGAAQQSYDKQYLRDWLTTSGLKGKPGVSMSEEVVRETAAKYREAYEKITGEGWPGPPNNHNATRERAIWKMVYLQQSPTCLRCPRIERQAGTTTGHGICIDIAVFRANNLEMRNNQRVLIRLSPHRSGLRAREQDHDRIAKHMATIIVALNVKYFQPASETNFTMARRRTTQCTIDTRRLLPLGRLVSFRTHIRNAGT
nr:phosphoribosylaminoimidazole-succinocarboxamide synthase [Quercus suber]